MTIIVLLEKKSQSLGSQLSEKNTFCHVRVRTLFRSAEWVQSHSYNSSPQRKRSGIFREKWQVRYLNWGLGFK